MEDRINREQLKKTFGDTLAIELFEEIDSTNEEAKRRLRRGQTEKALLLAESQTAGRGRVGHSFYSPKYTGIYLSLVYPVPENDENLLRITAKAAVAVVEGIQSRTNVALSIKWVNDIYIGNKKVAGILTEHVSVSPHQNFVIVGIGVNVTTPFFPGDLVGKATSLNPFGDTENRFDPFRPTRTGYISAITEALLYELDHLSDTSYLTIYREYSNVLGHEISYESYGENGEPGNRKTGTALEIDDDGALVVLRCDGTLDRLTSGEIRVRALEGV